MKIAGNISMLAAIVALVLTLVLTNKPQSQCQKALLNDVTQKEQGLWGIFQVKNQSETFYQEIKIRPYWVWRTTSEITKEYFVNQNPEWSFKPIAFCPSRLQAKRFAESLVIADGEIAKYGGIFQK